MKIYEIKLTLQEPMTIGAQRMIGNQLPSQDFIPATALRGALAAGLARNGRTNRLGPLFDGPAPRWCPAWLHDEDTEAIVIPMPLSFLCAKGDEGFEGALGVINTLIANRPADEDSYKELFGAAPPERLESIQWVGMPSSWLKLYLTLDRKDVLNAAEIYPRMGDAMFHGADYLAGAAWGGDAFFAGRRLRMAILHHLCDRRKRYDSTGGSIDRYLFRETSDSREWACPIGVEGHWDATAMGDATH